MKKLTLLFPILLLLNLVQVDAQLINKPLGKISAINKNWQPGGIFDGELPRKEILAARTEYTKKFDKGNGIIDMIFGGPFHYTDNTGAWQDIDLNLKNQENGIYTYLNEKNRFVSRFAQSANDGAKMEYKNKSILFGINTSVSAENWSPVASTDQRVLVKENGITYKNLYASIDLGYELTTGATMHRMQFNDKNIFDGLPQESVVNIEETIELPLNAFLVDENGKLTGDRKVKGDLLVIADNDTLYTIGAAHAWDGNDSPNEIINIETAISFLSQNKFKLIATIPAKWLLAPDRVYPVVFDPTVSIGGLSSYSSNYRYPLNTCRLQRISQFLFLKSDLNAQAINTTGTITDIAFFQDANNPMVNNQVAISLKEVTENVLSSPTLETGLTQCFNPANLSFTTGSPHWTNPLIFSSPFTYNNNKNLLIEVRFNNCGLTATSCPTQNTSAGGHAPGGQWGYYNAPYVGHRWQYSNSCAAPPSPVTSGTGIEDNPSYGYFIPATRITINTSGGCIPITINSNPISQTVAPNSQAQFSVNISGTTPAYMWEVSTNGGSSWSSTALSSAPYSGYTTPQLTINPTNATMNQYKYRCKITNNCTSPSPVISNPATLTINASGCTTVIVPVSINLPATATTGSFAITVSPTTCFWSVSENETWITITSATSGSGNAQITYSVTANTGPPRTGIIYVNGQPYTVNQQGAAAPTTYTISGRVIYQGSSTGIPGVTVKTTPLAGGGTTTTDPQGYYTLNPLLSYSGNVSASLQSFTFTPASIPVSPLNNSNKNFTAPAVSIQITNSTIIPPWQREGDDYNGTITVQILNTGASTNFWHLEANVYDATGLVAGGNIKFPPTNSASYQFNTSLSSPSQNQQLKNLSLNGRRVEYVAVFDGDNNFQDIIKQTNIIERKWDKKNIVYYNNGNEQIKIPLLYYSNIGGLSVEVYRPNYSNNPCGLSINCNQKYNYLIVGNSIVAQYPTAQNPNDYLIIDPNDISYNLKTVEPGDFTYKITYYNNQQQQVSTESGTIEITKIGKINYPNSSPYGANANRVMVFIGGIWNTVEEDIYNINNHNWNNGIDPSFLSSENNYSIISYFNSLGYDTWYIAQGNSNGVRQNSYDLGISLARIQNITGSTDINIITHSKGGLEIKALLGSDGFTMSKLNTALDGTHYNFAASQLNGTLKKVLFLATPHQGSLAAFIGQNLNPSPGRYDLKWDFGLDPNHILNILNSTVMPSNVRFANLTDFVGFDMMALGDYAVNLESGTAFNPNNGMTFLQLFQNHSSHLNVHTNDILSNNGECLLNIENSNLEKIKRFFNNQSVTNCTWGLFNTFWSGQTIKSILSNTGISLRRRGLNISEDVIYTDENGKVNFQTFNPINIGDTVILKAPGVDEQNIIVDQSLLNTHKFITAMFKSTVGSPSIQDPSVSLVNQNPITNSSTIQIKIFAKNANQYFINQHNSNSIFTPVNSGITTITLDTGYNKVTVKFIGLDTVFISKDIYYYPDTLYDSFSTPFIIQTTSEFLGSKMFINNIFYQNIQNISATIRLLNEESEVKFCKYGFSDTTFKADASLHINLSMQPYSYSSTTDSTIFNFSNGLNPQYWKTITVKNLSQFNNVQLSAKQYDDSFVGMSLKPQTRKFIFRRLNSLNAGSFKTAVALDQINTPDKDSVYLLSIKGNRYIKYQANETGVTEYDPEVQKVEFDKLDFTSNDAHSIVLMQKQAPIMKNMDTTWHSGQTLEFPLSMFITDPDSIKNDITASSSDAKVSVSGSIVYVTAPVNFTGTTTFSVTGTHDFLDVTKTYIMKVIPPEVFVPNAFTPNNNGRNDVLRPTFMGKLLQCHFTIFNRWGQKIFETSDCLSGWDGRINGKEQASETFVYYLTYQFEGTNEVLKEKKGTFTLIR